MADNLPIPKDAAELLERAGGALEELQPGEVLKAVPYVKHALAAYRWVREHRMRRFLRALNDEAAGDARKRERLEEILQSGTGQDILAEYCDVVLRTASPTAGVALALLYADSDDDRYPKAFKHSVVTTLEGVAEHVIDAFLVIASIQTTPTGPKAEGPYPVYALDDVITERPELEHLLPSAADRVVMLHELQRRGFVQPDHASTRFGGGPIFFGLLDYSRSLWELLTRARLWISEHPGADAA